MANGSRGGEQPDIASAHPSGRWPANLIHDGSDEVVGLFPETKSGALSPDNNIKPSSGWSGGSQADRVKSTFGANSGSAARFFYCAKASRKEREAGLDSLAAVAGAEACDRKEGTAGLNNPRAGAGRTASTVKNVHPTVKPIALMRYLVRLVTPPGGMVLDPFCGSGTTLAAAALEGFRATGIERDPAYCEIASKRVEHWTPDAETEDPPAPPKGLLL
jgi:site-specific DNA-methyltransferase (adenine-specific)